MGNRSRACCETQRQRGFQALNLVVAALVPFVAIPSHSAINPAEQVSQSTDFPANNASGNPVITAFEAGDTPTSRSCLGPALPAQGV